MPAKEWLDQAPAYRASFSPDQAMTEEAEAIPQEAFSSYRQTKYIRDIVKQGSHLFRDSSTYLAETQGWNRKHLSCQWKC